MIEGQKKAGTAPESADTWVAWLDSCVVRFALAFLGPGR